MPAERFSVSFYLVGMLFILFDVEAVFLYPWAVVFKSLKWSGFIEMTLVHRHFAGGLYLYLEERGSGLDPLVTVIGRAGDRVAPNGNLARSIPVAAA